jgi:hypothetical protein
MRVLHRKLTLATAELPVAARFQQNVTCESQTASRRFTKRNEVNKGQSIKAFRHITNIAPMMEAARTSETSVDIQLRTRQYIPEDSELHTSRRENLKSQK